MTTPKKERKKARRAKPIYGDVNVRDRRFYINDNLRILQNINTGVFHLVYIDPPFKSEREWQGTPGSPMSGARFDDRWYWDDDKEAQLQVIKQRNQGMYHVIEASKWSDSLKMAGYLVFMGIRIIEFHRVLRPGGAMYLHCDHDANSYLKQLMDVVFGPNQFRAVITWRRHPGGHNDSKKFGDICDTILYYVKNGAKETWNQQYRPYTPEEIESRFRFDDNDGRGPYQIVPMHWPNNKPGTYHYSYKGYPPPAKGWRCPLSTMERWDKERRLIYPAKPTGRLMRKGYLSDNDGVPVSNLWTDITSVQAHSRINSDYPTQKPRELLHRIIKTSTNPGDWVLDGFAGCGTTAAACETIGVNTAEWAKNKRNWVGIDCEEYSATAVMKLLRQCTMTPKEIKALAMGIKPMFDWGMIVKEQRHIAPLRTDWGTSDAPIELLPVDVVINRPPWARLSDKQQIERLRKIQELETGQILCPICGRGKDIDDMNLDHIVPRSKGGANTIDNKMLLCGSCNRTKRDRLDIDEVFDDVQRIHEGWGGNGPEYRRMNPAWTRERMHGKIADIRGKVQMLIDGELAGPTEYQRRQW